ncbi:MAG: hypothetical protein P8X98_14520, partial [Woeseiaceae bacterium]
MTRFYRLCGPLGRAGNRNQADVNATGLATPIGKVTSGLVASQSRHSWAKTRTALMGPDFKLLHGLLVDVGR